MISSAPVERDADIRDPLSRHAFLSSHRALAVRTREFARLAKELVGAATALAHEGTSRAPVTSTSPDRCIVQLGGVALTVAWLRNGSDAPSGGQLLAIVWQGMVAPRAEQSPERLGRGKARTAPVAVWEQAFVVSADSESTWHWHPDARASEGYTSPELAVRCINQLRIAQKALAQQTLARETGEGAREGDAPADPDILI